MPLCRSSVHEGVELTSSMLHTCLPAFKELSSNSSSIQRQTVQNTAIICRVALVEGVSVADEALPPLDFSQVVHSATSTSWQGSPVCYCLFPAQQDCIVVVELEQTCMEYICSIGSRATEASEQFFQAMLSRSFFLDNKLCSTCMICKSIP